jgi:hypothetical protein
MARGTKRKSKTYEAERLLTPEFLNQILFYKDGNLYWKHDRRTMKLANKKAGSPDGFGHIIIGINYVKFAAHRLVWIMFHGKSCEHDIDHINRDPKDNRIENLRPTNDMLNRANAKLNDKNKNGFKGVWYRHDRGKYAGIIRVNKKIKYLGHYNTAKEAAIAYNNAALMYFGEFASINKFKD